MAETTGIEWTDATFNPWIGCTRVSPGCDHCYAAVSTPARSLAVAWGAGEPRRRTSASNWQLPERWNRGALSFELEHGRRRRMFCSSLADWLDNEVPIDWLVDLLDLIRCTPNLDWLLLTKRIGNSRKRVADAHARIVETEGSDAQLAQWVKAWLAGEEPSNVWVGATIVNREEMLRDALKLAKVPARVRFWSCEPLLEDLGRVPAMLLPHWIIAGGESGPQHRPCDVEWLRSLKDEAVAGGVPLFVKQLGGHPDKRHELEQLPPDLRVRQWPDR